MKKKEGCIIMKATERFYVCEHCGNMAGLIHDAFLQLPLKETL